LYERVVILITLVEFRQLFLGPVWFSSLQGECLYLGIHLLGMNRPLWILEAFWGYDKYIKFALYERVVIIGMIWGVR